MVREVDGQLGDERGHAFLPFPIWDIGHQSPDVRPEKSF
jgi:hypothetical protein